MASSNNEGEILATPVTDYHFVDDKDEPISFALLPMHWCEDGKPESIEQPVFLHGVANGGNICKQVTAWKFELLDEKAEVSVLSKTNNWIKLHKPRKIYEGTVSAILITLDCLHFVQRNLEMTETSLWNHLEENFSSYEIKPSEIDLLDQLPLIREAVEHNKKLSESKFILTFLKFPNKKVFDENIQAGSDDRISKNVVDDEELYEEIWAADEGEGEETDLFDSVCTICDNGGEILCCEGRCMRSFHATVDGGAESDCISLGLSKSQIEEMPNFLCLNCQHKRHQCFACGKLGSSDRSSCPEVFCCVSATCGYFYHPECIAKLLHLGNNESLEMQKRIAAGESFTCPAHICHGCKERENKEVDELQFAVCRRCPRAYHRKCLPRDIVFEDIEEEDVIQRAWDGLLPNNRVLIYCLDHEMDKTLSTPIRNHLIFPHVEVKKKRSFSDLQSSKGKVVENTTLLGTKDSPKGRIVLKIPKHDFKMSSDGYDVCSSRKREKLFSGKDYEYAKESKTEDACRRPLNDNVKSISETVDTEAKRRVRALMARTPSITLEEIKRSHKAPSTHAHSLKFTVDKTITMGKVEGFVEAVRNALQKLEEGGNLEDAKAVCGPEVLHQIIKWKSKLKVYLAPFLHGTRYTSFGRHFTKVDKLKEIVEKLHWYVRSGDTIVDFCCGSNDFSCLMKNKLEITGKNCSFKNFDIFQPKNDFSFEKRDWMTVGPQELPNGSKLIMGLNPPFGVKAALANKFIKKALEFKPKLLILIVPPETARLHDKRQPYDLIWEDDVTLSGKSFYLPGSVDVNDNQMLQWNNRTPPLYLWSRRDFSALHRGIALRRKHISRKL
ncbi:hypothetical protein AQUCO_07600056v1 [Aquilegia coerulea]|uniref:Zinc finger PHD-type domain-containing protein n=1 Tax=Aquilegia coerulea TaxID=218851 RepID=A0A2G5C8K1_AQUCA|nr:hypothetical protein AQUCO_07600056v1 [Aquilegia coerulea]